MTRTDEDHYTLSSGRKVYANCGIIGIVDDKDEPHGFSLSEGYDSGISLNGWDNDDWTLAERIELARFMVDRWSDYVDALKRDGADG